MSSSLTSLLLVLPVLLPLVSSLLIFSCGKHHRLANNLLPLFALLHLVVAVALVVQVEQLGPVSVNLGNWPAPFAISFIADRLSSILVLTTSLVALLVMITARHDLADQPNYLLHLVGMNVLVAGVCGAFMTGDLFNLYVWFEVILIGSFVLMTLDSDRNRIEGATKYVALNLVSTLVFLLAIGLLYGATGALNLADLHTRASELPVEYRLLIASLFMFGFAIKAAVFPLYSWLPASYHLLPGATAALFAALPTKVGIYAMLRFFSLVMPLPETGLQPVLAWLAALTMLVGVAGALAQPDVRRKMSFLIIASIGYLVMGIAIFTPLSITGTIFYLVHAMVLKALLLLVAARMNSLYGHDDFENMGGLAKAQPLLAVCFLIAIFSMAGFPPFSGFWGKFILVRAGIEAGYGALVGVALLVGLLTLFALLRIWTRAFWRTAEGDGPDTDIDWNYDGPILVLTLISLALGLYMVPLYEWAAGANLLNPTDYVDALLGASR